MPAGDPAPGDPGPPRMAPPEPDPPKPPPEPEPPKPEPPKPEPKPEPKVEPKPEPKPKPDPVKETKPKPDSEKPKPKTETAKTTDSSAKKTGKENTKLTKAEIKEMMSPLGDLPIGPKSSGVPGATGFEVGVRADEGFPSELSGWARLVRRKILLTWEKPAGIKLTADNNKAEVAFWVDRQGNLLGDPQIVSEKSDPELSASGVKAIVSAAPLPPLPDEFKAMEQEVIFEFMLIQQ